MLVLVLQVLTAVSFHRCFGVSVLLVVRRGTRAASLLLGAHQPKKYVMNHPKFIELVGVPL